MLDMWSVPKSLPGQQLSRNDIIWKQLQLVKGWQPSREVWPLNYGTSVLSAMVGLSGMYIHSQFRRYFRFGGAGILYSYTAVSLAPVIVHYVVRQHSILPTLLLRDYDCPLCVETRSGLLQLSCGIAYPLLISSILNLSMASYLGQRIPDLGCRKSVLKYFKSILKPIVPALSILFIGHSVLSTAVTYTQMQAMERVTHRLQQFHKKATALEEQGFE